MEVDMCRYEGLVEGGLNRENKLAQLHFHWVIENDRGKW